MAENPPIHMDGLPGSAAALDHMPEWRPRFPGSGRPAGEAAIVTGADPGIGRAVAARFASDGADVAIRHLDEHDGAAGTRAIVAAEARRAPAIPGDKACREEAVAQVIAAFGRLVDDAGEQHRQKDIVDIGEVPLRRTFRTGIFGQVFRVQAARPHLEAGAAIVTCAGETGCEGASILPERSAIKGAITAFPRSLSESPVPHGIRVDGVAPGPVRTPLNPPGGLPEDQITDFGKKTPMGRPGQPSEAASCCLVPACADGSCMSGQVLHADGGTIVAG